MAGKAKMNDEFQALMDNEDLDTTKIADQITGGASSVEPPKTDPPKVDPPKTEPLKPDSTKADPQKKDVQDIETIRTGILNEMFGDQFKTVDDVKKANIPASLQELVTLRQTKLDLETQLAKKPKHSFASDDIAKFNEFARETGIKDASVFNKINVTDIANMGDMDALVLQHIIENPTLAGQEPQVRRYFERKYDVDSSKIDPKKVESGDLTEEQLASNKLDYQTNLIGVTSEGNAAKKKLLGLKEKIKMPEVIADEPDKKTKKWTPEIETQQKAGWSKVNEKMVEQFAKLPIRMKGATEPIVTFVIPEEASKAVLATAMDYIVSNQLEASEETVKSVARMMYSDLRLNLQDDIMHAVFERARSMKEEEYLRLYHNPSKLSTDAPVSKDDASSEEAQREAAYQLENKR